MSVLFTAYDPATGAITQSGSASNVNLARGQADYYIDDEPLILLGVQGIRETEYVDVGVGSLIARPTITGLDVVPVGTRVFVDDEDHGLCGDGVVEVETDIAGTYRVRLEPPFPYQPYEIDVVIS